MPDPVYCAADQQITCPSCGSAQGILGVPATVRVNPRGRLAAPTPGWTYSWHCRRCPANIEIQVSHPDAMAA